MVLITIGHLKTIETDVNSRVNHFGVRFMILYMDLGIAREGECLVRSMARRQEIVAREGWQLDHSK